MIAILAVVGIAVLFSMMDHKPVDISAVSVEVSSVLILGG
jgi:hypothetical protein